jgi:hypothetical protein
MSRAAASNGASAKETALAESKREGTKRQQGLFNSPWSITLFARLPIAYHWQLSAFLSSL